MPGVLTPGLSLGSSPPCPVPNVRWCFQSPIWTCCFPWPPLLSLKVKWIILFSIFNLSVGDSKFYMPSSGKTTSLGFMSYISTGNLPLNTTDFLRSTCPHLNSPFPHLVLRSPFTVLSAATLWSPSFPLISMIYIQSANKSYWCLFSNISYSCPFFSNNQTHH